WRAAARSAFRPWYPARRKLPAVCAILIKILLGQIWILT
ncbi:hypothetical protein, partial [Arthrobacter sp. DR-2P]